MTDTVLWFRRDLRLLDHPALLTAAAAAAGGRVVPLFVLDPALWDDTADPTGRQAWLAGSLAALHAATDGALVVRRGRPQDVVPEVAAQLGAPSVHVTADTGPYGRRRDARVEQALDRADRRLVRTGTSYAVGPGTVRTAAGSPYAVFTPFRRAWLDHGCPAPAAAPAGLRWARTVDGAPLPQPGPAGRAGRVGAVGEGAAAERWAEFLDVLDDYGSERDRPDHDGTSRLSAHLKFGEIHPRTLLAALAGRTSDGASTFRAELIWREFYADVLWHRPQSAWESLRPELAGMQHDEPAAAFDAWREGRTGFPFVDAGMRQLRREGWMHNRLRMVTASFLVKDLHVAWQCGAHEFLRLLVDGDIASNNHGWQWVAGTGTDAAPYFRVFNPVTQGLRFDPDGDYVRRYVPELAHLPGKAAHQPWQHRSGYDRGYPERMVDHAAERQEALRRYQAVRSR